MMKVFVVLLSCFLVTINAASYGGQKTTLESIERDYTTTDRTSSYTSPAKPITTPLASPTKFGFIPFRTAPSYAATQPKFQYSQTHYQLKKPSYKAQNNYHQHINKPTRQTATTVYQQSEKYPTDYGQQYSAQQYLSQQNYASVQPQQYSVQYQQPGQYEQYENVQYVNDNALTQESQPTYAQPQYYYVQQYQSPSTAVETVADPKGLQYVYVPSYSSNSIPVDQKYAQSYSTSADNQLPPVTTTVAKYTSVLPGKYSNPKQAVSQKYVQYQVAPSSEVQNQSQDDFVFKREPKSLLDSYVPSIVQLQYLKQHGKQSFSKY